MLRHVHISMKMPGSLLHLPSILFLETGFLTKSRAHRFGYLCGLANCLCTPGLVTEAHHCITANLNSGLQCSCHTLLRETFLQPKTIQFLNTYYLALAKTYYISMPFQVVPQKPKVHSIIILSLQIRKRPAQGHVTSKWLISSLSVFSIVQYVNGKFINRGL